MVIVPRREQRAAYPALPASQTEAKTASQSLLVQKNAPKNGPGFFLDFLCTSLATLCGFASPKMFVVIVKVE